MEKKVKVTPHHQRGASSGFVVKFPFEIRQISESAVTILDTDGTEKLELPQVRIENWAEIEKSWGVPLRVIEDAGEEASALILARLIAHCIKVE